MSGVYNILALILTSAELLKAQAKGSPALLRAANVISSSAHRGADIAKQLLLFARSEKGEQRAISLFDIVTEIRQLLEHSMPGTITFETEVDRGNDVTLGDSGHLHQVVTNLALNARDAMPDGGRLTIRVAKTPLRSRTRAIRQRSCADCVRGARCFGHWRWDGRSDQTTAHRSAYCNEGTWQRYGSWSVHWTWNSEKLSWICSRADRTGKRNNVQPWKSVV